MCVLGILDCKEEGNDDILEIENLSPSLKAGNGARIRDQGRLALD
jgi:hypothetical protein